METSSAIIPTRSKRQAMDWSLVLASQDIPTTIALSAEERQWALLVNPEDYERAVEAIRQYREENRGWSWRHPWPGQEITFHWGGAVWCGWLVLMHGLSAVRFPAWKSAGMMDSAAVFSGEWWRLFTAISLHADLGHLMTNVATGILILGFALARFGAGFGLLASFVAGAGGNVAGLMLYPEPYRGVGASGMMMGALGLLAVQSVSLWGQSRKAARYIMSGVLGAFMLLVFLGLNPATDVVAHVGGFMTGCLLGSLLALAPGKLIQKKSLNWAALFCLGALCAYTWWRAVA
ncbi:MAG: rhomboid family intramembrane serine protease [Verrucomicrobiota bacterium]